MDGRGGEGVSTETKPKRRKKGRPHDPRVAKRNKRIIEIRESDQSLKYAEIAARVGEELDMEVRTTDVENALRNVK